MPNLKVNGTRHIEIMGGGGSGWFNVPPNQYVWPINYKQQNLIKNVFDGYKHFCSGLGTLLTINILVSFVLFIIMIINKQLFSSFYLNS